MKDKAVFFKGKSRLSLIILFALFLAASAKSNSSAAFRGRPSTRQQLVTNNIGFRIMQQKYGNRVSQLSDPEELVLLEAISQAPNNQTIWLGNQIESDERNLKINLRLTTRAGNNQEVREAILRVVNRWQAIPRAKLKFPLTVPFEITIDVDFGETAFGKPFTTNEVIALSEMGRVGTIPSSSFSEQFSILELANYKYQNELYQRLPFPILTDLGETFALDWSAATSISVGQTITQLRPLSHILAFNSRTKFDFDPTDGIDPEKIDFEAIALREFGRFLGFISNTDLRSATPTPVEGPIGPLLASPSLWDLYRFQVGVTTEDLTAGIRVQRARGEQIFFTGDLEAPLASTQLSPGSCCIEARGSGFSSYNLAAGHWKDDALTGQYLGIMDESYLPGERGGITALDVAALTYFLFGVVPDTPVFEVLSTDDNSREQLLPASNVLLLNRLTPARAPSVLESIRVQLPAAAVGKRLRLVGFHDAQRTGQPLANPTWLFDRNLIVPTLPAHGMLEVMLSPVTLNRGDLYVGAQAVDGDFSFAADTTTPRGRSFSSNNNGGSFQPLRVNGVAANAMLRAALNTKFNAVGNRPPELTALSSTAVPAGKTVQLTVFGQNFYPISDDAAGLRYASIIRINGREQNTEFLSSSQLRTELDTASLGTATAAQVTVHTQTPAGGLESTPLQLTLTPNVPVPVLVRAEPTTLAVTGGQKLVTLHGRNFVNQTMAQINGATRTTKVLSDTKLEITLNDADVAQTGAFNLMALNPAPGGGVSNALPLTVAGCTYRLSATGRAYQPSRTGETLDGVFLETQDHCPWTVTNTPAWVHIEGPASGVGRAPIGFTVLNNAGGGGRTATLQVGGQSFLLSQPGGLTAVSAANFEPLTAVDAIASIFSSNLASTTQAATTSPLPTSLAGTRVTVRGTNNQEADCPLFFVSPTQINLLLPASLPVPLPGDQTVYGTLASVYVNNVLVASGNIRLAAVAPSLFTANATGQGVPAGVVLRLKADGSQSYEPLAEFDVATNRLIARPLDLGPPGERVFLILFGTGFRRRTSLENVSVIGAGFSLPVSYAGSQGDLAGVDQLNVELIRELQGRGEITLQSLIDGRTGNPVTCRLR